MRKIPMVLDFRDSWASWPPITHAPQWRQRLERNIERRVFGRVAAVTTVNDAMSQEVRDRHTNFPGPVKTLPQAWDPNESSELRSVKRLSESDGILRIVYGGIVRPDVSDPSAFFDALRLLKDRDGFDSARLRVTFMGNHLADLNELASNKGIADIIQVEAHRDRGNALAYFARADALLMIGIKQDRDWITGKIWDYLSVGRPIIVVGYEDTAAARLVTQTRAGWVAPPDNVPRIVGLLEELWKRFRKTGRLEYSPDAKELLGFSLPVVARKAAHLLDEVIGNDARGD